MPIRVNPRMRITRSIFKTFIDVLHLTSTEKKRIGQTILGALDNEEANVE
jgi:DNA replication licensing factor MCM4